MNRGPAALSALVPPTRAGRVYALVALVDSAGTGCYLAGSTIYFLKVAGLSATQVSVGLAIANTAGLLAAVPMGSLATRVGPRRMLVVLQSWRAVWFAVLGFVTGPVAFTLVSVLLLIAERSVSPVTQAVVTAAVGEQDRVHTMAAMRSVRNIGFSVGAASTAPLLALHSAGGYRAVILADVGSFVITALMLVRLRLPAATGFTRKPSPLEFITRFRDWGYLSLAGLNGVLILHVTLLGVALPVWIADDTRVSVAWVSALVLLNTVCAVLLQVPFSKRAERPGGGVVVWRCAAGALTVCCVLLALSGNAAPALGVPLLIGATLALTAGELWQSSAAWEISYRLAPADTRIEYLSVFSLGYAVQEIVGPLLVIGLLAARRADGWVVLALLFLVAGLIVGPAVRWAEKSQASAPAMTVQ